MTVLGVIPVRLESQRLPRKPLALIEGKSLVQRVWEQAKKASEVDRVIIATDADEIIDHAHHFGAEAIKTRSSHLTGSDRVSEVSEKLQATFSIVANIQGDMPFINPQLINGAVRLLKESPLDVGMTTVATPIQSEEVFLKESSVKVVLGENQRALYFSRAPVPFIRDRSSTIISAENPFGFKHMGLYVFRPEILARLKTMPESFSEKREKLEQLRLLSHGVFIRVLIADEALAAPSIEVDTETDLEQSRAFARTLT